MDTVYFSTKRKFYRGRLFFKKAVEPITVEAVNHLIDGNYEIIFKDRTNATLAVKPFGVNFHMVPYLVKNNISYCSYADVNEPGVVIYDYDEAVKKHKEMVAKLEAFGLEYIRQRYNKEATFDIVFNESNIADITSTFSLMIDGAQKGESFDMDTLSLVKYDRYSNEYEYVTTYGIDEDETLKADIKYEIDDILSYNNKV